MKFDPLHYRSVDYVVFAGICSPSYLLFIRNHRGPTLVWKFIGERRKRGEYPYLTLERALWEEGGLMIRTLKDILGAITLMGDENMVVSRIDWPLQKWDTDRITGKQRLHEQYFYKVKTTDERLLDLSEKRFPGPDPDEEFETGAFLIKEALELKDFFDKHEPLLNQFVQAA